MSWSRFATFSAAVIELAGELSHAAILMRAAGFPLSSGSWGVPDDRGR